MRIRSLANKCFMWFCRHSGRLGIRLYHTKEYHDIRGKWPHFNHPLDLSEFILASIQKKDFLKFADLADKVKAPNYVRKKGLGDILLKHYAVWDNVDSIDITDLPDKFILKPNNSSGGHIICRDKKSFDLDSAKKSLTLNLLRAEDYAFEPHYLKIEPKIFAEELLDLGEGNVLTDYKFNCIKGLVADIFLAGENENGERKWVTVNENWEQIPYIKKEWTLNPVPKKPERLQDMIKYAQILSADFDYVRVDFYEHEGHVYFSELTFSPWGGFQYGYSNEALLLLGAKMKENV